MARFTCVHTRGWINWDRSVGWGERRRSSSDESSTEASGRFSSSSRFLGFCSRGDKTRRGVQFHVTTVRKLPKFCTLPRRERLIPMEPCLNGSYTI